MKTLSILALGLASQLAWAGTAEDITDGVCFYQHSHYKGAEHCYLPGQSVSAVANRDWSSIRVIGRGAARIYKGEQYQGDSRNVMANAYELNGMNDAIASVQIYRRSSDDFACMFDHDGFRGDVHCLAAGQSESDLTAVGYNDATSSMQLFGDVAVTVFENVGYGGKSQLLSRSTSDFNARPGGWLDDNISSWKAVKRAKRDQEVAIELQERLGDKAPLHGSTVLGSHNSFNSSAYNNTEGFVSPNQRRSLTEQLEMGARMFEFDAHSYWSDDVALCHASDGDCFWSPWLRQSMRRLAAELNAWLNSHPRQVLYLYLNDYLGDGDKALLGQVVASSFGTRLYRPQGCENLSPEISNQQVLAADRQIVVFSDRACVEGLVFARGDFESGHSVRDDGTDFSGRNYVDGRFSRAYECDHPNCTNVLNAEQVRQAQLAGINSVAQDQLVEDGKALYQLWAFDPAPASHYGDWQAESRSARLTANGHYYLAMGDKGELLRPLCHDGSGWRLAPQAVGFDEAAAACAAINGRFEAPKYLVEADKARQLLAQQGVVQAHIAFGVAGGRWQAD
ncbi:hypothetical protein PVT67_07855 [Gallaecimonas kandeliae]|uniref:hypothetical protein n=1 Tax=Gallaecimonas kandeliae TaxID=3029055 RepID=UPI002649114C|nr:hypothetical protein [Gallaecimonas kandeliae]WKE67139.1 hypothetical protein PVT67_07855 [Gallaecimonas kandeliae]